MSHAPGLLQSGLSALKFKPDAAYSSFSLVQLPVGRWFKLALALTHGALAKLAADYQHMVDDGLFLDEVESFDALLRHCQTIQEKANATPPTSRTKLKLVKSVNHRENDGYEEEQIH